MKKSLLKLAGLFSIVASLFLVSCKNETPTSPSLDTVLTLDKAQVSVTAYPGMNFVSWLPVTNANGYVLYIYVGGNCISSQTYSFDDDLCYVDTNIKNNVDYTYIVEAESSSSTGRQVVTQNSMSDKKTVKAIVPPYNTKAFDLGNSEKNPNSDFIVRSDNIKISSLKNKVSISFPGKAYLAYEVSLIDSEKNIYAQENLYDPANNNVILYTDFTVTQPGTYKVKIIAKSINTHFADSGVVISNNSTRIYNQILTATFYYESGSIYDTISVENTGNDDWNTIKLPSVPAKDGYKGYWRKEYSSINLEPYSSVTLHESNTDFYPEYELSVVTVYFKDDYGNELLDPITKTLEADGNNFNTITLPSIPEKEGFISSGYWYNDNYFYSEGTTETLYNPYSTFYTDYLETRTAYFFDENGNSFPEYTKTVVEDDTDPYWNLITFPPIEARDGYLAFWVDNLGVEYAPNTTTQIGNTVTNYTILYRFLVEKTVDFYDENGNLLDTIILTENLNNDSWNVISLPAIEEQTGYIAFWKDTYGNTYAPYTTLSIYEDTSFTRMYRVPETRYANFLDKDGNIIVEQISVTESLNDSSWNEIYLPSIPEKQGYISDGYWYDNEGNKYSQNSYFDLIATTTNFTAKYIRWEIGEITSENNVISYTLNCEAGSSYSVSWADSYQGDDKLTELLADAGLSGNYCDVKVSIYSADGSQNVVTGRDSGYDAPITFTATVTGEYIIEVQPYSSGYTGYFGILIY